MCEGETNSFLTTCLIFRGANDRYGGFVSLTGTPGCSTSFFLLAGKIARIASRRGREEGKKRDKVQRCKSLVSECRPSFRYRSEINRLPIDPDDFARTSAAVTLDRLYQPLFVSTAKSKLILYSIHPPARSRQKTLPHSLIGKFETRRKSNPDSFPRDCSCRSFLYRPLLRPPFPVIPIQLATPPPMRRVNEKSSPILVQQRGNPIGTDVYGCFISLQHFCCSR